MFSASYFALSTALLTLIASTSAGYVANSKNNVAIYYGQGPNEAALGLASFCDNSEVDIIPLGFLDIYPAQGNGWPGTNFASSCGSTNFAAPGYDSVNDPSKNDLKNDCPTLVDGIAHCQAQGKQILLSLGGAPGTPSYQLTSTADALFMADFLWGAFGPLQNSNNYPRPFDTPTKSNSVDGFDFDIETIQPGEQQYYITMINRLISYFPKGGKKYLITGAPQCITPDSNMGDMISAVPFDILFVQYYNTDSCSAHNWKLANPKFPSVPENPSGFSYEFYQLLTFLDMGASKKAKIFFGLPGAATAANANEYLDTTDVTPFLEAYYCQPRFGGVMVWEGIYAYDNNKFQNSMKSLLIADSKNAALPKCPTPPPCCTKPYTIAPGDYCSLIASSNGLSTAAFYALNPSLGPNGENCVYLQPDQTLCLARASSTTAVCSIASTTTSTTTSATPSPTACVTCTQYYTFVSGSTCYDTWTAYKLTSTEFYALNPTLTAAKCGLLQPGAKVCVAGTTHTCPTSSITSTTTTSTTSSTSSSKTSSTTATTTSSSTSSSTTKSSTTTSSTTSSTSSSSSKTSTTTSSSTSSTSSSSSKTSTTTSSTSSSTLSSSSSTSSVPTSSSTSTTKSSTSSSTSSGTSSSSSSATTSSTTSTTSTSKSSTSSSTTSSSTSSTSSSRSNSSSSSNSSTTSSSIASSTSTASPTTSSPSASSASSSSTSFVSFGNSTTSSRTSTSGPVTYTTTTTSVYTVTSCPPTVTNCPVGHVTTDILTITTTYCPASAASTPTATSSPMQYTTSVVYTTLTYTITACPATVTNCPAKIGSVTTETKVLYTTICPVTALTTPVTAPTSTAPGSPAKEISNPVLSNSPSTSLIFFPVYSTAGVPKASSSSSSFAVVYQTMSVMPVASTSPSKSVVASASPVKPGASTFTGGAANAASLGVGGIMTVVLCMVGWVLL